MYILNLEKTTKDQLSVVTNKQHSVFHNNYDHSPLHMLLNYNHSVDTHACCMPWKLPSKKPCEFSPILLCIVGAIKVTDTGSREGGGSLFILLTLHI